MFVCHEKSSLLFRPRQKARRPLGWLWPSDDDDGDGDDDNGCRNVNNGDLYQKGLVLSLLDSATGDYHVLNYPLTERI